MSEGNGVQGQQAAQTFQNMGDQPAQAQTQPAPAAQTVQTTQPAPAAQTPAINDELAYYKAQAEKFERLVKKLTAEAVQPALAQSDQAQPAPAAATDSAFETRIKALEDQLARANEIVLQTNLEQAKSEILDSLGLKGEARETAKRVLIGTSKEELAAQAEGLKSLLPKPQARVGVVVGGAAGANRVPAVINRNQPSANVFSSDFHQNAGGGVFNETK